MKVEIRADNSVRISGYVNAVERESRPIRSPQGEFVEMVAPGTFGRAIREQSHVDLMVDHERTLGSTADGTLTLREDNIGLYADAVINDPGTVKAAREKRLRGWSFGFGEPVDEMIIRENKLPLRVLRGLRLDEVSIITDRKCPVYLATSIETRDDGMRETRAGDDDVVETVEAAPAASEQPGEDTTKIQAVNAARKYKIQLEKERYHA